MKNKSISESIIYNKNSPFCIEDIIFESGEKYSKVYKIIKELQENKKIVIDHKVGRKIFFNLSQSKEKTREQQAQIFSFSPKEKFEHLDALVNLIIDKKNPSLLVTGTAGIGKTYAVKKGLNNRGLTEEIDFHYIQGHSSPLGLYSLLHDKRESIFVFDDCDSIFRDEISINILKCALDSYETRRVCWNSSRLPENLEPSFIFSGSIIFISNFDSNRIDEAIKSRTITINLTMSRKELSEYIYTIIEFIEPKIDIETKKEVLEYLVSIIETIPQFNIRTFIKACRIREFTKINKTIDWKPLILSVS